MSLRLIAVTGGIGAGKSTVSRALASHGARVLDADHTAREVVDPTTERGRVVLRQILAAFGPELLKPDGSLDRDRTASLVFVNDEARHRYNAIIHPAIRDATAEAIAAERVEGGVLVHEIPLLTADTPVLPWSYDLVVTVEASEELRASRLQQIRGYTAHQARDRIAAQGPEGPRRAVADVIVRTDGSLAETLAQAKTLWTRICADSSRAADRPQEADG